jgi:hypothetical protein
MEHKTPLELFIEHFEDSGITYGDHISHADINNWCAFEARNYSGMSNSEIDDFIKERDIRRMNNVEGLKKHCLEKRQMYLKTIYGAGYQVVHPRDQTQLAVEKGMKEIAKGMKTMRRGTEMINTSLLSPAERAENQQVRARRSGLEMLLGKKKDLLTIK